MIARKTTLIIIQNAIGMMFGYTVLKFIALEIGKDELGMVAYGFGIVALLSFVTNLGFGLAHMKRISEGKDLGKCIGTYTAIKFALTALMAGLFILAISIYKMYYPMGIQNTTEAILYAVLVYFVFSSLASIPLNTFDARAETTKSQMSFMVQHPVKLIGGLIVVFSASEAARSGILPADPGTAFRLALTYYSIVGLVILISAWAVFLIYKYPIKRPDWAFIKSYTVFALPVSLSSFMNIIILNTDKVMIGFFWQENLVGSYFGVQKLTDMIMVVPIALGLLLLPVLSSLRRRKKNRTIRKLLLQSERYTSMIIAPATFFIFFFSYQIIHLLLSDDFLDANWTLSFLGIYAFARAMSRPRIALLQAIDRPDLTAKVSIVVASLNVLLNALLIPGWSWFQPSLSIPGWISPTGQSHYLHLYQHTGAAVATTISALVGFVLLRYLSHREIKAPIYHGFSVKHFAAAFTMSVVLLYISSFISQDGWRWFHLVIFGGVGVGIYIGILALMGEFRRKDLSFFTSLMDPRSMGKYISTELKEKDLGVAMRSMDRSEE